MHLVHYLKKRLRARSIAIWASILFIFLNFGHAQTSNPFDTKDLISKNAGDTFDSQIVYYLKLGGKLIIFAVMVFGIGALIAYLMSIVNDSKREGIAPILQGIVICFVVVIFTGLLANFAWNWITNFQL
ncbi:hypothetical protein AwWohl_01400 [Gammaproteobacteria bacterium]|nr:hypothetical protein AwWohl_01400 [Gammaproteobacteria bacterium]